MSSPGLVKSCVEDINLLLLIVCPNFFTLKFLTKWHMEILQTEVRLSFLKKGLLFLLE